MAELKSDIRVREVQPFFSYEKCRVPLKFGAVIMDELSYCHVRVEVENKAGAVACGWGSIFLAHMWAFPTKNITPQKKDEAMKEIVTEFSKKVASYSSFAHPIDIFLTLEPELMRITREVSQRFALPEEMPPLAALVCASPIDAALHDAFGNVNKISSYDGYNAEFMKHDLSHYLGKEFKGLYISDFLKKDYAPRVPVFHLVGGLDKLRESEITPDDPNDGLPVSLDQWVRRDKLICLKIKLRGNDLEWDVTRTREVVNVAHEVQAEYGRDELYFSADTNEQCESPEYIVEYLMKLKEASPKAFQELLYVEQPTERELRRHSFNMREIAKIKPVIIDESLVSLEDFDLALKLGWSGVALKTCKGHSKALLYAARAEKLGIPYTIQDLTNPGLSLIHSVGLGARLNPMKGVESNSCQFFPQISDPEARVHPNIFTRRDGYVSTESIKGYGLGYQIERIEREIFHR
jgi:L-alanine-DL-glutamate epimerase-like enolase superfamily enzyme